MYQFSSVAQSCLTLCDPMNHSTPGLPVHHQLPNSEFAQTHVHQVGDAIQPPHPLSSPCLTFLKRSGWAILNMKKLWWSRACYESVINVPCVFQEAHHSLWITPEGWGFVYRVCVSNKMAHRAQTEENCLSNCPLLPGGAWENFTMREISTMRHL